LPRDWCSPLKRSNVNSRTQAVNKAKLFDLLEAQESPGETQTVPLTNLPAQLTSFIGRVDEISAILKLLKSHRLVVLTGPGGSGKSRLALRVADELIQSFRDGVWLVELAPLDHPGQVADAIAHALKVSPYTDAAPWEALKRYLANKHILLVLDSFEHLLEASPRVGQLLAAAPQATVMATSRERLYVYGEQEYQVQPLDLPDLRISKSPERLRQYDAIKLFVQRASAVQPGATLDDSQIIAVASICARLDGLPLAIELAAARTMFFDPHQLLARLESRLSTLTSVSRDVPSRQCTLRDTIDWSYDLLNGPEQRVFNQLGVFSGGFSFEAATTICDPGPGGNILEILESLLNKSLIYMGKGLAGEPRLFMLETIHEYARGSLEEDADRQLIRNRHLTFFRELAEGAEPHLWGAKQLAWLETLDLEYGNLRAALAWSQTSEGNAETGLSLAGSLEPFWEMRGYFNEGRDLLSAALIHPEALDRTTARARALSAAGLLAYLQSDYPVTDTLIGESLTIYRELGHTEQADYGHALITLGDMKTELGEYSEATSLITEALGIMQEVGDLRGITRALWQLGTCAIRPGEFKQAIRYLQEALPLARQTGDKSTIAIVLTGLSEVAIRQGEYERATALEEESLALRRQIAETWGIAISLANLAWIAISRDDLEKAVSLLEESLDLRHEIGDIGGIAWCLEKLAEIAIAKGRGKKLPQAKEEYQRASRLFGSAQALREPIQSKIDLVDRLGLESQVAEVRAQLDDATFAAAWEDGQKMTVDQAVAYALGRSL
jgi:predicted ATPase